MAETKTRAPRFTGSIDLSGAVDAAPVKKDSGIDLSQYKQILTNSWNKVQAQNATPGFRIVVSADAVSSLKSRFRVAAKEMNLGCAFSEADAGDGSVAVTVQARQKKAPRGSTAPASETPKGSALPKPKGGK